MKNLGEQAKIVRPVIWLIFSYLLFIALCVVLFLPILMPNGEITKQMAEVEFLKDASDAVNGDPLITAVVLVASVSLLLLLPIVFVFKGYKKRYRPSPFPMGLDRTKFSEEENFIYNDLVKFFYDGGLRLENGFACAEVYTKNHIHFASIRYVDKQVYVLINRNFTRSTKKDRRGFVPIPRAGNLALAKKEIFDIYNSHFRQSM
ncbi:MAG: hypothetical protein FWD49_03735 [Firmicutes bacterium]|nr:hypothetical protein [Bacillota bacterium]